MKRIVGIGCLAIVALSTAALAFQEQKRSSGAAGQAAESAVAPSAGVSGAKIDKPATGTVVRIPGLGELGVLPKMDFGLELLYGAAEAKTEELRRDENAPSDDLTIRGRIKHNF
ncbi:MAG: hypothetical protein NW217_12230 [Hyphomicrobiaceae bacterium]|nr:hypothetical protein [Hyphomicrobiaceae bacterium]